MTCHAGTRPMLRRTSQRGFSLIDVAVGITLFTALFGVALSFMLSLNNSAEVSFARSQLRHSVVAARTALESDLGQAQACGGGRVAAPFSEFGHTGGAGEDSMLIWVDADTDGKIDLVGWRVDGERLQRTWRRNTDTSADPAAGCAALTATAFAESDWRNVLRGVRPTGDPNTTYFQGVAGGYPEYFRGSCTGSASESCDFDAVRVRLITEPSESAGPATIDSTFRIATPANNG